MKAGDLRHRVTFQRNVPTINSFGEYQDTYSDAFTVWGSVEPLTGSWLFQSMQANSKVSGRVHIRYRDDVLPTMRMLYDGRYLKIVSIINPNEKNEELQVLYSEALD